MTIVCAHCGVSFEANRPDRKVCSRGCAALRARAARKSYGGHQRPPEQRKCLACGGAFLAGGRGNKPRKQLLCSDQCQRDARIRKGQAARTMTSIECAYLAGIIDGEGSIMICKRGASIHIEVGFVNTHRGVLEWAVEKTGLGTVLDGTPAGPALLDGRSFIRRRTYQWRTGSDSACSLLQQLQPHLVIKKNQADLAILTHRRLRNPRLKAIKEWQEEYRLRMHAINMGTV